MTDRFEKGLNVRKDVLGAEHVARSMANVSEFNKEIQELVTSWCWGDIWTREGISRRDRSLINLAILTAMNRNHEFKVHVKGALTNGCTPEEIKEVLLQTAVYCGVPAALESFRNASEVLAEWEQETDGSSGRA
ncbi:carboxymuconolactone decarboxylase family protein [Salisediminibacterium beveridgei]|uniref:4-carboxymuconolactone decarboxylase n=1 Tax=Salisediminibacterium beveridgei TaxID=632773 RepID=A0A1D7QS59_9BACI|nr:carboxymuconolactone decarboxylase family protein [Salisediminibacterium beveridgei]AOM81852.1 4-carboxymuconolactone decarboxylase [Salisediminibacterium beveridgei]